MIGVGPVTEPVLTFNSINKLSKLMTSGGYASFAAPCCLHILKSRFVRLYGSVMLKSNTRVKVICIAAYSVISANHSS